MTSQRFADPLGNKLPALEKNLFKIRATQMLLVLFYAEELKRDILSLIQNTDKLANLRSDKSSKVEPVPTGTKNPVRKALAALVADMAITDDEKDEIEELIDYRNLIGHHMHDLMADLSSADVARRRFEFASTRIPRYDYHAVDRLQHFHKRLNGLYRTHGYLFTVGFNRIIFQSAERTFLYEIKQLNKKIVRLNKVRCEKIRFLNHELLLEGTEFVGRMHPRHPLNQYDNGRLTARGVEICYRLFDHGKSTMAVAHLLNLSLIAARKRKRIWESIGHASRPSIDIEALPHRKFYALHDD